MFLKINICVTSVYYNRIQEKLGIRKEIKSGEGRRKITREWIDRFCVLGILDWDGAPRRGPAAGEGSRRDRCRIKIAGKKKKTNWGAWFYFTLNMLLSG